MKNQINAIIVGSSSSSVRNGRSLHSAAACLASVCLAASVSLVSAQSAFKNLGFDEGVTNNMVFFLDYGSGRLGYQSTVADLLPGWTLLYEPTGQVQTNAFFMTKRNDQGLGGSFDGALVVPNDTGYGLEIYPVPLGGPEGKFSLVQTGEISLGAKYIEFYAAWRYWDVRINGTNIPLVATGGGTGGSLFNFTGQGNLIGDVSAFAGQTVQLKITVDRVVVGSTIDHGFIDNIRFVTPPSLSLARSSETAVLTFTGTLQSANAPTGPWTDVTSTGPVTINPGSPTKFYRARQ